MTDLLYILNDACLSLKRLLKNISVHFLCRSVIGKTTALRYLNLSSCRYLPRGVKRIYRGKEDIYQLLDKLD